MAEISNVQSSSSTDFRQNLINYQFQTTRSGELVFSDRMWFQGGFPEGDVEESVKAISFAIIDGDLRLVDPGQPPGLRPPSGDASILGIREP